MQIWSTGLKDSIDGDQRTIYKDAHELYLAQGGSLMEWHFYNSA